ncbi:MAG: branched-chain amino acid ABC transporter permease [Candidatus Promineifilaceae bacterium]|nr:branched-chain amino acid ABC transporter permease [Candidatus Promineifilaceae bacterium]
MSVRSLAKRYEYKKWQLALLSIMFPAAYGAVILAFLVESLAAAFFGQIPESANLLFVVLLLFTLFRYGLLGAIAGYLGSGNRRSSFWLAILGGTIAGLALFFISNIFLKLPLSAGQIIFVLIESAVLSLITVLIVRWAPRFPFRYTMPVAAILFLAMLAPVALANDFRIGVVTEAYFLAIMAASWALLAGVGGQFSFAQMAFMAIGAYTSGLLGRDFGVPPLAGVVIGTMVAGLFGFVIGVLCLPLRRAYLALFTIAFSEILRIILVTEFEYTEGSNGLQLGRLFEVGSGYGDYYVMLFLFIGCMALMYALANSRFGMFWRAIREDQEAAAAMGVNVVRYKVFLFVITAMIAGLAGATFYHTITIIVPTNLELLLMSTVIAMAVIGSLEILIGAAIGAFVLHIGLEMLREITLPSGVVDTLVNIGIPATERIMFGTWRFVLFGLLLMLTLRFARNGLLFPVFEWLSGSAEARKATVAKRDQASESAKTEAAG